MKLFLHRLVNWEYWPFGVVYFPIFFVWAYFAIKARTIFFFNAANPSIKNGGFMAESKKEIYDIIPQKYYPKTILVQKGTARHEVEMRINSAGLSFPLIAKPDIGLRGSAVKKIGSMTELADYLSKADFDFLVQELIPYDKEVGIFYVRFPGTDRGRITGIVSKEFATVTGDGTLTLRQLISKNPRFEMQMENLEKEFGARLDEIPPPGETVLIIPYGNHARGAKFLDHSHLISKKLTNTIDSVCREIAGFYFGRLDIMYNSFEELEAGSNFQIVELNGTSSEPTHIYDPQHSIFFAWKELSRHIAMMYGIGRENHKNGVPYLSWREGVSEFRKHRAQSKKITSF